MGTGSEETHETFVIQPAPPKGPGLDYRSAEAFATALKHHLGEAAATSSHTHGELRRQFAYDRLLARLFTSQPEAWVLKGGAGLLARLPGQARHSQDIDLYFQGVANDALIDLIAAAEIDLSDYFTFDIEQASELAGIHSGHRYKVIAHLGAKQFVQFGVDVVVATNMTGRPEAITNLSIVAIRGLPTAAYRTYPVADHIADKHAAMLTTYANDRPSSRHRDLVDLVLLATTQTHDASELRVALLSEYAHRGFPIPSTVVLPSPAWEAGYAVAAAAAPELGYPTATAALTVVKKLLDPILAGRSTGTWDPVTLTWSDA